MWKDIKIANISEIEKCVAEFDVSTVMLLPYARMRVKIFENKDGRYTGYTDVRIKNKLDGTPEGGIGYGKTIDEALEDTLNYFMALAKDYEYHLEVSDIEYSDWSDF